MNKIIISVFLALMLFITACGSDSTINEQKTTTQVKITGLSLEDRYAKFEADVACRLIEAGNSGEGNAVMAVMGDIPTIAEKYGITEQDISDMKSFAENDEQYKQKILAEVQKMCPETYDAAVANAAQQ